MVMGRFLRGTALGLLIGLWVASSMAAEVTVEQIKEIDEQMQSIKKEMLGISTDFLQLEEKLIYPPNSRLTIFVSVAPGDKSRLDALKVKIDGKPAANYIYSSKELDALQRGGVQRIYTGHIRAGEHALEVAVIGKSTGNSDFQQLTNHKFTKEAGEKRIEISVAGSGSGSQAVAFKE